ncbi:MAG: LAGLIDADG family homing endonuclease, partial [Candidatus Woesebacteria bacterium]|nr:LAGLIDADG family homing endonuclease [Candidatus Woesebacteria bacterium]
LVSTDSGLLKIENIYKNNLKVRILSDSRLSDVIYQVPTKVLQTGEKQVYKLKTVEGYELKLTGNHKVLTERGWVESLKLTNGDKILISNRSGGFGTKGSLDEGQIIGWLVGDGTMKRTQAVLSFFGHEKQELAPKFAQMVTHLVDGKQMIARDYSVSVIDIKGRDEARVQSTRLARYMNEIGINKKTKLSVPENVLLGNQNMQKGFLQALFTADGHVAGTTKKGVSVRLTSISESLLKDVQKLLLNFGIVSRIYTNRRFESMRSLPDGKGGKKEYLCKAYSDLAVSKSSLIKFNKYVGFLSEAKNLKLENLISKYKEGPYKDNFVARFKELVKEGIEMVYDLTVPSTSSFVANGLVVHNCGEQMLPPYVSCNLGSIDLSRFVTNNEVNWKGLEKTTQAGVRFLDGSVEEAYWPVAKIREKTRKYHNIGLGVMGWADMLILLGIPYDSDKGIELGEKVMKFINDAAEAESKKLGKGKRKNITLTSIAPTGSISLLAGCSSGIEPVFGIVTMKNTYVGSYKSTHWIFEYLAKKHGFYNEELLEKIATEGSTQNINEVPDDIKKLFKTAMEVGWEWHVKHQAAFQKYTDNAVSKTINLPNDATLEDVQKAYLTAYETNCKSITVYRDGSRQVQVMDVKTKERSMCPNCNAILFMNDGEKTCVTCGYKPTENEEALSQEGEQTKNPLRIRPDMVKGSTYKMNTPVGTAFITINEDESGDPLEMFINVGKAGSDVAAMAEALGRSISTALKFRGEVSAKEKAREFAEQLSGIGGRRSIGFGPTKIKSLPDAIAAAISVHYDLGINGYHNSPNLFGAKETKLDSQTEVLASAPHVNERQQESLFLHAKQEKPGDICPTCGAGALVFEEGCSKCYACGHSEC